jgi:hypothetical protein
MTQTNADHDPIGELADATRLLKAAYKLVEYHLENDSEAEDNILGVLYAVVDKILSASKMLEGGRT